MAYIDGFVIAVAKKRLGEYLELARQAGAIYKEYGALRIVETVSDDVPKGKVTDFFRAVQANDDEVIIFSYVEWPDKESRNIGNEKVMADKRMKITDDMPMNLKTMIWGGFESISIFG